MFECPFNSDYQLLYHLPTVTPLISTFVSQYEQSILQYRQGEKQDYSQLIVKENLEAENDNSPCNIFIHKFADAKLVNKMKDIFLVLEQFEVNAESTIRISNIDEFLDILNYKSQEEIAINLVVIVNTNINNHIIRVYGESLIDISTNLHDILRISDVNKNHVVTMNHELSFQIKEDGGYFKYIRLDDSGIKQLVQKQLSEDRLLILYKPII